MFDEEDPIDVEWDPRTKAMINHPAGKKLKSEEDVLDDI